MKISLELQQKQVLSLKQQQSVAILQMNTLALSEYARALAEENPLLEWNEMEEYAKTENEKTLQKLEWLRETDEQNRSYYRMEQETEAEERQTEPFGKKEGQSLREYLLFQINTQKNPQGQQQMLHFLAESTAESGYLEADVLSVLMERYAVPEETAVQVLASFQSLDPAGVGARGLRECLLIQLKRKKASALAIKLAEEYLDALAKNQLTQIAKKCGVSVGTVAEAFQEIRACQPKPGSGFVGEAQVEYVMPDVFVEQIDGEWQVTVNGGTLPQLHISRAYIKMLREGANAETEEYISEKLKQAEWAMQCIRRRESTLQQVAEYIVRRQAAFFSAPRGELAPLRLADVAEALGLHESTVSRAVKEKYLQCERGTFPLSAFFSQAMPKAEEASSISAESIKNRLKALIAAEDRTKPLSDRELTEQLTAEGIRISRRTVAKYREALGIAGASGRKVY